MVAFAGPSFADPKPSPGDQRYTFNVGSDGKPTPGYKGGNTVVTCEGFATPPFKSGNTLQWAGHVSCSGSNGGVGTLELRLNVYKLVGTGDNERKEWVDFTMDGPRFSWFYDVDDFRPCVGTSQTRYVTNAFAYFNGAAFVPTPAWSSSVTLACGA